MKLFGTHRTEVEIHVQCAPIMKNVNDRIMNEVFDTNLVFDMNCDNYIYDNYMYNI